jgi:TusA-related sulfurtransferase
MKKYMIKFTKDVTFLNKAALRQELAKVPEDSQLVIDATHAGFVDADILETLNDFTETAKTKKYYDKHKWVKAVRKSAGIN